MRSDFHDAVKDARAELASEVYISPRDAVIASLNACHGNGDMYPVLRDRQKHPYGWSPLTVPTDGHPAPASPLTAGATPTGLRAQSPPDDSGARADGSHLPA